MKLFAIPQSRTNITGKPARQMCPDIIHPVVIVLLQTASIAYRCQSCAHLSTHALLIKFVSVHDIVTMAAGARSKETSLLGKGGGFRWRSVRGRERDVIIFVMEKG